MGGTGRIRQATSWLWTTPYVSRNLWTTFCPTIPLQLPACWELEGNGRAERCPQVAGDVRGCPQPRGCLTDPASSAHCLGVEVFGNQRLPEAAEVVRARLAALFQPCLLYTSDV